MIDLILLCALLVPFVITIIVSPYILKRLKKDGFVGVDVNKADKRKIPELGGICGIVGFIAGVTIISQLDVSEDYKIGILCVIGVLSIAAMIGIIDDIHGIKRRKKALYLAMAALPLIIIKIGYPIISLRYIYIDFSGFAWFYWFLLVPLGVTGLANAINMSAGYNGLESGEITIISFFMFLIMLLRDPSNPATVIFAASFGASLGMFAFNMYPAKMFIGDVGTQAFGALLVAGIIMGNIVGYALILILPVIHELISTIYFSLKKIERRNACMNPIILEDGRLKPPEGAEHYTLFYRILSIKPMKEWQLVSIVLGMFIACGVIALLIVVI